MITEFPPSSEFRKWLESLPDDYHFSSQSITYCPIARWLQQITGDPGIATSLSDSFHGSWEIRHPKWVVDFISSFDTYRNIPEISPVHAIRILNEICPP